MKRTLTALVLTALVAAVPATADAAKAKGIAYKGKTSSGHKVTFRAKGKKMYEFVAGVPVSCVSIQGGGKPLGGVELWDARGWWIYQNIKNAEIKYQGPVGMYYNKVTKTHHITSKRSRNGKISGKLRIQYSMLFPKYPIGTFVIYSCLGTADFSAKPAKK